MVVAIAEVGAALTGSEAGIGLLYHVIHDRRARRAVVNVLVKALVIVRFPKRRVLLRRKEVLHVEADILGHAVHTRYKHVEVKEHVVGAATTQAGRCILEQPSQHLGILRESAQEELLRRLEVREHGIRALVHERVAGLVGTRSLDVFLALMGIDRCLRSQAGEGRYAGSHGHDGTYGGR